MAKYDKKAQEEVAKEVKAMEQGKLTIGKSDKKVTNRKQAIAIGLDKARREGAKVPMSPKK